MDELMKKMNEYTNRFDDAIPLMQLQGLSTPDIIELIDKALETGEKINTNFNYEDYS